jgi:hypothetical protein
LQGDLDGLPLFIDLAGIQLALNCGSIDILHHEILMLAG